MCMIKQPIKIGKKNLKVIIFLEKYNEYYIQGSDHYLIPKDVFKELFNEMVNWKEEFDSYYFFRKRVTKLKYSKKLVVTSRSALID